MSIHHQTHEMLRPDDEADSPSSSVEQFSKRMRGQGMRGDFGVERSDGDVVSVEIEVFVDLVRHEDDVVLDA